MSLREFSSESTNQLETQGKRRRSAGRTLGETGVVRALYSAKRAEALQRMPITNPEFEKDRERIVNEADAARANSLGEIAIHAHYPWSHEIVDHEDLPE